MLPRTLALAMTLGLLACLAVSSSGAGARESAARTNSAPLADPVIDTWAVQNQTGSSPWRAGDTVTIRGSSQGEAVPEIKAYPAFTPNSLFCGRDWQNLNSYPGTSWYALTYHWSGTWSGGGTLMGCQETGRQGYSFYAADGRHMFLTFIRESLEGSWVIYGGNPDGEHIVLRKQAPGTTKTVNAPAPGKSVEVKSPPLPATPKVDITVSSSKDDAEELAIFGPADVEAAVAVLWVNCWTLYGRDQKDLDLQKFAVKFCVNIIKAILKKRGFEFGKKQGGRGPAASEASRRTAATGCTGKPLAFRAQLKKGSKKTISSLRQGSRKPSANSVRYSCAMSDGQMKITVQTTAKGGLRKALGRTLDLRVYRSKKAARGGKLTVSFGW